MTRTLSVNGLRAIHVRLKLSAAILSSGEHEKQQEVEHGSPTPKASQLSPGGSRDHAILVVVSSCVNLWLRPNPIMGTGLASSLDVLVQVMPLADHCSVRGPLYSSLIDCPTIRSSMHAAWLVVFMPDTLHAPTSQR